MNRPNIIYLHSHDTGRYIQPYGYGVPTPNLQRLAGDGVLFRQAFCAAPTCSASRAALLTGQSPHNAGMTGLVNRGWDLADHGQHLVHTLGAAGYHTVLGGLQHVTPDANALGFDQLLSPSSHRIADVAPAVAAFLQQPPRQPPQPFFLDAGVFETHRSFPDIASDINPHYARPPATLPDTPETRQDMAAYITMARQLDDGYGVILDALERADLAENTLVIATTDHGVAFPGCKCNLTDHGIGVLLIMRGPHGFRGGRVCDAMVSHIDLFPTLCDLLDVDRPPWLQGRSIMPLVRKEAQAIHDHIFAEVTYHAAYEPMRAVRSARYKYIRRYLAEQTGHTGPVLANCDDSPSKEVWLRHGWAGQTLADEQLYDLIFDPGERHNLVDDPALRSVADDLRARLHNWMQATDDPLLHGIAPRPPGTQVNALTDRSPQERPR